MVAHAHCAGWSRGCHRPAPTLAEVRAFLAESGDARGVPFVPDELRLSGAVFAFACACTALRLHRAAATRSAPTA